METEKTPWRKNLDKRYISGEDLLLGEEMNKGLRKEMVVTLSKWEDSPAFDQKSQKEVDKTAIWLKEYPSGKPVYKPALLNVVNGAFLSKEIGGDSLFIDDFDTTKPFVIYACPDKRHGHVARFKKYIAPNTTSDKSAIATLASSTTLAELQANWSKLTQPEQALPTVIAEKDRLKAILK
jgi:hypothetical protein